MGLSVASARRIALAAQGFAVPRPAGAVNAGHINRLLDRLAILQLDSVNVFCRTHYLPVFSRLGPYDRDLLDRMAAHTAGSLRQRSMFEYWAHEACLVRMDLQPLMRWRMARARTDAWGGMRRIAELNPGLLDDLLARLATDGPMRAGEADVDRPARVPGQMWQWHDGKVALEYLFWSGQVTAQRRVNFERRYHLTDRVLPPSVVTAPTPSTEEAQRELVRIAARAYGIATEPDLGDYFRLPRAESKARVAELVDTGELVPVDVDGWGAPAYLHPAARKPRSVTARALISPFDPLIWFRPRAQRLFGVDYRIEIYTPADKRRYGYYVLPFLLGDQVVARVDLKSDRQAGVLRVQSTWLEPGHDPHHVADQLAAELATTAGWLGLSGVEVMPRGDLADELARHV